MVREQAGYQLLLAGVVLAAMGLTWYVLPRVARRPLRARWAATLSFWLFSAGTAGLYLGLLGLGTWMAGLASTAGLDYLAARDSLGLWITLPPLAAPATAISLGYGFFAASVLLTGLGSRGLAEPGPMAHLRKFFVAGSLALLAGALQMDIQLVPDVESHLLTAGWSGIFVSPTAQEQLVLLAGVASLLVGVFLFHLSQAERAGEAQITGSSRFLFWTLVPGSLLLYGAEMGFGLTAGAGEAPNGLPGIAAVPLVVGAVLVLLAAGRLILMAISICRSRSPLDMVGPFAALGYTGVLLGFLCSLAPALAQLGLRGWIAEEAGITMVVGAAFALVGLTLENDRALLLAKAPASLARRALAFGATGLVVYQAALLVPAALGQGSTAAESIGSLGAASGMVLYAVAFGSLAGFYWTSTRSYRASGWRRVVEAVHSYDGPRPSPRHRTPASLLLGIETLFALSGFPGFGWLMSGRGLVGLSIAMVGPAMAWAVMPTLISPYGETPLAGAGIPAIIAYLACSAVLSVGALALTLARESRRSGVQPLRGGTGR